jgi:hypothetical protein
MDTHHELFIKEVKVFISYLSILGSYINRNFKEEEDYVVIKFNASLPVDAKKSVKEEAHLRFPGHSIRVYSRKMTITFKRRGGPVRKETEYVTPRFLEDETHTS